MTKLTRKTTNCCSPRPIATMIHLSLQLLLILLCCCLPYASDRQQWSTDFDEARGVGQGSSCPSRCAKLTSSDDSTTAAGDRDDGGGGGVRIAYLIIVHNNRTLRDAVHLYRSIRSPRNLVLVHVDKKVKHLIEGGGAEGADLLHREVRDCSCGSTTVIESVHDVQWSKWSMLLPTLWGMEVAVNEYWGTWDVFINLSGDTMPVYTADRMSHILSDFPYNFVTSSSCETGLIPTNVYRFPSWWHKRSHYTRGDTEPDPVFTYNDYDAVADADEDGKTTTIKIVTHFGSQWMILQAEFCGWLVRQLKHEDSLASQYQRYLVKSGYLMTDETYIPSLIANIPRFNASLPRLDADTGYYLVRRDGTVSTITDVRYERMDEHYPTAFGYYAVDQRYEVPESKEPELGRLHPWGPYFLGVYDMANIRESGAWFIRKVSADLDPNMIHFLPVDNPMQIPPIQWPDEISISSKPDWEKKTAEFLAARKKQGTTSRDNEEEEEDTEDEL